MAIECKPTNVGIVEDDPLFLRRIRDCINAEKDMRVGFIEMSKATTLKRLNSARQMESVEVLIVDLGLPDGSGLDLIALARERWPHCSVLVSSCFSDEANVLKAIEAGATGYLLKDIQLERIPEQIRCILAGGSPMDPLVARLVLNRFNQNRLSQTPTPTPDKTKEQASDSHPLNEAGEITTLSAREREVFTFLVKGYTVDEIGTLIGLSNHTVLTYVRRTYTKLHVRSKAEAIFEARMQGWV